eukprot:2883962-Rhodomonas_salina.1
MKLCQVGLTQADGKKLTKIAIQRVHHGSTQAEEGQEVADGEPTKPSPTANQIPPAGVGRAEVTLHKPC